MGGVRGFDVHKRVKGRKRPLPVDMGGLVLSAFVSAANVSSGQQGARWLLSRKKCFLPSVVMMVVSGGPFVGGLITWGGLLLAATLGYGIGSILGVATVDRLLGSKTEDKASTSLIAMESGRSSRHASRRSSRRMR